MISFKHLFLTSAVALAFTSARSQTHVFAQLQGSPMVTTGWNMTGSAAVSNDELVLTTPNNGLSGSIFYGQQLNLALCQKWTAEYEFRMFDGNGADGIALCFLETPPSGFISGGMVGLPDSCNGLKIVLDTYNNRDDRPADPIIEIRYGRSYHEFNAPYGSQPTLRNAGSGLRSNAYQQARVTYDNGTINVYINGTLRLTGNYVINFPGYLGFTSSTGGFNDRNSIRNVTIYTDLPIADAGNDTSYCSGSQVQIGTTATPGYTYSWSPAVGLSATNVSSPNVTLTNTGTTPITFTYTVTTSQVSGCSAQDQVTVTVSPVPTSSFSIARNNLCTNEPTTITYTGNGSATANYAWNFNGGTVISGSGRGPYQVSWASPGTYPVTLSVSANGCTSAVSTKTVNVTGPVYTLTGGPAAICAGDTAVYTASSVIPGTTFAWSPGALTGGTVRLSPGITTTYSLRVTIPSGCFRDTTFTLTVKPRPTAQITGDTVICKGDSTLLTGISGGGVGYSGYRWIPDGDTTAQILAKPTATRTYKLVTFRDGCVSDTAVFKLRVDSVPVPVVPDTLQICLGDQVNVTVAVAPPPGTQFKWLPGDLSGPSNTLSPTVTTEYSVYAYTQNCTSETKTFEIKVLQSCDCKLEVPNAFTPNGDQVNDQFFVKNLNNCALTGFNFVLYNRWGTAVWHSNNIDEVWNGKYLGSNCSDGTYFWVFTYSYAPGGDQGPKSVTDKGTLTIAK